LLGNTEKAKEHWDEFVVVRDPAFGPGMQIDFDKFKHHVLRLQNATRKVTEKRSKINFPI